MPHSSTPSSPKTEERRRHSNSTSPERISKILSKSEDIFSDASVLRPDEQTYQGRSIRPYYEIPLSSIPIRLNRTNGQKSRAMFRASSLPGVFDNADRDCEDANKRVPLMNSGNSEEMNETKTVQISKLHIRSKESIQPFDTTGSINHSVQQKNEEISHLLTSQTSSFLSSIDCGYSYRRQNRGSHSSLPICTEVYENTWNIGKSEICHKAMLDSQNNAVDVIAPLRNENAAIPCPLTTSTELLNVYGNSGRISPLKGEPEEENQPICPSDLFSEERASGKARCRAAVRAFPNSIRPSNRSKVKRSYSPINICHQNSEVSPCYSPVLSTTPEQNADISDLPPTVQPKFSLLSKCTAELESGRLSSYEEGRI